MRNEIIVNESRVFHPGWGHTLRMWWWWGWRTVLCSMLGGAAWAFVALAVLPPDIQEKAVIGVNYLWGLSCSIYFLKSLFTNGRFYDFAPALIKNG